MILRNAGMSVKCTKSFFAAGLWTDLTCHHWPLFDSPWILVIWRRTKTGRALVWVWFQQRTIWESVHRYEVAPSTLRLAFMREQNCAANTAAQSSRRGIVRLISTTDVFDIWAIRDLEYSNLTITVPSVFTDLMYAPTPYAFLDSSENIWVSTVVETPWIRVLWSWPCLATETLLGMNTIVSAFLMGGQLY